MKHSVSHDLGKERAKQVMEAAWSSYSEKFGKYSPTMKWLSEEHAKIGFVAKGISLDGQIKLLPNSIDLELDVPFLLKPFQKMAVGVIEGEIKAWIAKAKNGELA
jgi:Putative polyhydroxyalkanoic acid system protein (PHA_gran_rgn)